MMPAAIRKRKLLAQNATSPELVSIAQFAGKSLMIKLSRREGDPIRHEEFEHSRRNFASLRQI
jgi:hypothetical protein